MQSFIFGLFSFSLLYTIYLIELKDILEVFQLTFARLIFVNDHKIIIFTNNQAVIHILDNP